MRVESPSPRTLTHSSTHCDGVQTQPSPFSSNSISSIERFPYQQVYKDELFKNYLKRYRLIDLSKLTVLSYSCSKFSLPQETPELDVIRILVRGKSPFSVNLIIRNKNQFQLLPDFPENCVKELKRHFGLTVKEYSQQNQSIYLTDSWSSINDDDYSALKALREKSKTFLKNLILKNLPKKLSGWDRFVRYFSAKA